MAAMATASAAGSESQAAGPPWPLESPLPPPSSTSAHCFMLDLANRLPEGARLDCVLPCRPEVMGVLYVAAGADEGEGSKGGPGGQ